MQVPNRAGRFVAQLAGQAGCRAFVPADLPPQPAIAWSHELQDLLEIANRGAGRLDGASLVLPNQALFLYSHIRKEAVLSSQIEGTQSSLSDLLLFEDAGARGEFRRSQNWDGDTRPGDAAFVPPNIPDLMPAPDNLEKFLRDHASRTPALVKAALAHA